MRNDDREVACRTRYQPPAQNMPAESKPLSQPPGSQEKLPRRLLDPKRPLRSESNFSAQSKGAGLRPLG